jgi:hypothetical protein
MTLVTTPGSEIMDKCGARAEMMRRRLACCAARAMFTVISLSRDV